MYVDIQYAVDKDGLPTRRELKQWAEAALVESRSDAEITIRIVNEEESAELNQTYRHKNGPTNVLSFPAEVPEEVEVDLLGDLVICAPVVAREANEQKKPLKAHWAHMVVHGCLHLQGYDHQNDKQAHKMEQIETNVLIKMGFNDPYQAQ